MEYTKGFDLELYAAVVGSQEANIRIRTPLLEFPVYDITSRVKPGDVHAYGFTHYLKSEGQEISGKSIYLR